MLNSIMHTNYYEKRKYNMKVVRRDLTFFLTRLSTCFECAVDLTEPVIIQKKATPGVVHSYNIAHLWIQHLSLWMKP